MCFISQKKGPNDYRIGYTNEGDIAEFIPNEEIQGQEDTMILFRNMIAIKAAYESLSEMVWWQRHQIWLNKIKNGIVILDDAQKSILATAQKTAARIENRYGIDALNCDSYEMVLRLGRLSALAWVLGAEWSESLDT